MKAQENKTNWFRNARFGMFIHWGVYSVAERGEWILNRERMSYDEYIEKYANNFKAENYEPKEWAKLAKESGMKYMVLTTKHHDGFALWDTATTDFNATKIGPKKDLVAEYVNAVRSEGLKIGFYYSPADWHHSDYPDAYCRDWPLAWDDENARQRFVAFYTAQIKELVTNYGDIDLFWYDGCIPQPLDGEKVNKMIKEHQPNILISNRNGEPYDFKCCEQAIVPARDGTPWEACMTLNDNWGYHSGDSNYKSSKDVIKLLITVAKDGGNLLLNVGPKADGTIPCQSVDILKRVGEWLRSNGESIYGSQISKFSWGMSNFITVNGNKVYIHIYHKLNELRLAEIKNKIKSIHKLSSNKVMEFSQSKDGVVIVYNIEDTFEDDMVITLVCEIDGEPEAIAPQQSFWIPG